VIDGEPYKYNWETKRWDLDSAAGANVVSPNDQNNQPPVTGTSSGAKGTGDNEERKKTIQVAAANTAKSISNALEGFPATIK
jgi:hypothetical protein